MIDDDGTKWFKEKYSDNKIFDDDILLRVVYAAINDLKMPTLDNIAEVVKKILKIDDDEALRLTISKLKKLIDNKLIAGLMIHAEIVDDIPLTDAIVPEDLVNELNQP